MKADARQYTESLLAAHKAGKEDSKTLVRGLVQVLQKKRQTGLLKSILSELEEREAEAKGEVAVTIETAHELEAEVKKGALAEAEKMYPGKKLLVTYTVDPEIQSGFRIRSKDKVLDHSFKNKLHNLHKHLTHL